MRQLFSKYVSVGVLNTAVHWICFFTFYNLGFSQSHSNLLSFLVAVTFSFYMNAKFTFKSTATSRKYVIYTLFLGALATLIGKVSDVAQLPPILTLVATSGASLVIGFLYSHFVVFRERE